MQNLNKKNSRQIVERGGPDEGSAILIVLIGIVLFVGGSAVWTQVRSARTIEKKVDAVINGVNAARWVGQLLHDDQFCAESDFLVGISGWDIGELENGKILKETNSYVDVNKIGIPEWPGPAQTHESVEGIPASNVIPTTPIKIRGRGVTHGLVFVQPAARVRKVLITELKNGKKIYRIPVEVKYKGLIEGQPAFFDGAQEGYVELAINDTSKAVACYNAISSRGACLDKGGIFYPRRNSGPKCVLGK